MANKSGKGSGFERAVCDRLSLWWTQNESIPRTDIFWRSSNSGGRATVRKAKGKNTSGQYGDVSAIDPIGIPFLSTISLELKRGYSTSTISDLLDYSTNASQQMYEEWFEKVIRSHNHANSFAWMLLVKRDRRDAFCFIPLRLWVSLREIGAMKKLPFPFFSLTCKLRLKEEGYKETDETIIGLKLEHFLEGTSPKHILGINSKLKEEFKSAMPQLSEGLPSIK